VIGTTEKPWARRPAIQPQVKTILNQIQPHARFIFQDIRFRSRRHPSAGDWEYFGAPHAGAEGTVATVAKRKKDPLEPSFQAGAVIGAGRGALIVAMFGAGWLGWGLGEARAFTGFVGPAFGLTELFLLVCSIYVIQKGRRLRKRYPPVPASARQAIRRSFLLVVVLEILALASVSILAWRLHRPDLGTDWCAMVVGLHFLPLARIFRSTQLGVIGILITFWCVLCWVLFRWNALGLSVALGTGTLLWIASVLALFRARKIAHSLEQLSPLGEVAVPPR